MEPKYLRAKEMAKYLNIGLSTVWLFAKQGKLTPKKLSERVTLFSIEEADKIFASSAS
jgi:predicted DNA-binding transcriptional regulator AlpA